MVFKLLKSCFFFLSKLAQIWENLHRLFQKHFNENSYKSNSARCILYTVYITRLKYIHPCVRGAGGIPLAHPGGQRGGGIARHTMSRRLESKKNVWMAFNVFASNVFALITSTTHSSTRVPPQASCLDESRIATIQGNSP